MDFFFLDSLVSTNNDPVGTTSKAVMLKNSQPSKKTHKSSDTRSEKSQGENIFGLAMQAIKHSIMKDIGQNTYRAGNLSMFCSN